MSTLDERINQGLEAFEQHRGKPFVPISSPPGLPEFKELTGLAFAATYGDSWARAGLDLRTKSFITLTAAIVLGDVGDNFKLHLEGAEHVGIERAEIVEMLIHLLGYVGQLRVGPAREAARRA